MSVTVHTPVKFYRMLVVLALIVLSVAVLIWRAFDLHILDQAFLQGEGAARHLRVVPIATHRGMITDRNGEPLAVSTPVNSVWIHPKEFLTVQAEWPKLASLLKIKISSINSLVMKRKSRDFVYLQRHVTPEVSQKILALGLAGVSLQREYRRYYPAAEVASHVIGFTNIDDAGQEGLELAYNDWLKGTHGLKRVLKDRLGRVIKHVELIEQAKPGKDLALSIDRRLQYLTYRELKKAVQKHKAKSGSAVILDIKTGEVLAMVNQPSYNPNNRKNLKSSNFRNRAVTDIFEPGSTIKPFTMAAALESGIYQPSSTIDTTPGTLRVGSSIIRDHRNYGVLDLTHIIQKSSNVGMTKIALSLPASQVTKMHSNVGFGINGHSGFPGEVSGLVNPILDKQKIERATLSYGYGLSVTAMQLARAYAVIANKGKRVPVQFLRVDKNVQGKAVISENTSRQIISMMESVITKEGTGSLASIPGYRVAGKTGTVKKVTMNGYSDKKYLSIFAGLVPASKPSIVMVVTIDEPSAGVYYGGEVAAPVFSKVMSGALRILDIAPDDIRSEPQYASIPNTVINQSSDGLK